MSWLRVLTALGILAAAAAALLLFTRCTATGATRHGTDRAPDIRTDAEGSGLFPHLGGDRD